MFTRSSRCAAPALLALLCGPLALAGEYRVGGGDTLTVQVYSEPQLAAEVVVSETCTVSLALIGQVEVCGATTSELEARLTAAYADGYLVSPTIAVKVLRYHSQRVDVLGEVAKRGPQWLEGPTSLVDVISMAGGPVAENVVTAEVISTDGTSASYDLRELTASGEVVLVQPGDRIVLKPGQLVWVEGLVRRPGAVVMKDGLTVTQALALAGGPDELGNVRRVVLRRADGTKLVVNVPRIQRGAGEDPVLAPDDHVVVPRASF